MRSFLLASCPVLLWCFAAFHLVFLILLFRKYAANRNNTLYLLSALVTVGLFYDALILSLGTVVPAGGLLQTVSQLRFISHGALIPLLFPICSCALGLKKPFSTAVWALTAVLMVLGVAEGFATALEVREIAGVVRYASSDATPGWAGAVSSILSYGTVLPLIAAGIVVWVRQKTPALFLSGFLMFAFSALGPATGNFDLIFFISMAGEALMVLFFLLYADHRQKAA